MFIGELQLLWSLLVLRARRYQNGLLNERILDIWLRNGQFADGMRLIMLELDCTQDFFSEEYCRLTIMEEVTLFKMLRKHQ
jgi:hypothetical protein